MAIPAIPILMGVLGTGTTLYGLYQASRDPYKDMIRRLGADAQRLESSLASIALQRLAGSLDPYTRAAIQRAMEQSKAQGEAAVSQLTREYVRRGVAASGALPLAQQRLAEAYQRQGAATSAQISAQTYAQAQQRVMQLAQHFRSLESQARSLSLARKAAYIKLAASGLKMLGTGIGMKTGGADFNVSNLFGMQEGAGGIPGAEGAIPGAESAGAIADVIPPVPLG